MDYFGKLIGVCLAASLSAGVLAAEYARVSVSHVATTYSSSSLSAAQSTLRDKVNNALSNECHNQYGGHLERAGTSYSTYEEGHTQGKPNKYKLYASGATGKCRYRR